MLVFESRDGLSIRLTDERREHILRHPELGGQHDWIAETIGQPEEVRQSNSDPAVQLFYRFYPETLVTSKWLCVVVRLEKEDGFVITAYLTDRVKRGDKIWPDP